MAATRRWFAAVVCGMLLGASVATAASAHQQPVTKIRFELDAHHVTQGSDVTGTVQVWTRDREHHEWAALPAVQLSLRVDGVEVGTLTTGSDGSVAVAYTAADVGDHVMKVVFAGDDLHRRARRAQGFEVEPAPEPTTAPPPPPVAGAPDPPVLEASNGPGMVSLLWSVPADNGSPILGYNVYRGIAPGTETLLASGVTTTFYDDGSGTPGTAYVYVVTAVNGVGEGAPSNEVSGTPA
ncbi:MAG: fibronectin type III domain-containing protein [Candidatus Velamenicoccus archaeovorus]